uniref:Ribonuclease H-like domain-containing protein n=1 Tax=Tanacetum cinerariifolium TaxID=118510 RepID=A0A699HG78_TANCI|nr:ribonuclease H-like domain-containing protein [Tanacetum cinerariifolium]
MAGVCFEQAMRLMIGVCSWVSEEIVILVDDCSHQCVKIRIIGDSLVEFAMTDLGPLNYFWAFLSRVIRQTPVDTESKLVVGGDSVCHHMHDPRKPHLSALNRILRYVQGTLNYGLQLFSSSTTYLLAYSDADWAGCPTTRRSTFGYCVFLGNNLLSCSSKRQPTLSHSSVEAKYRGVANVDAETCWLRNLLCELHTPVSSATLVYCDNVSAVYLSCNPVQHQRMKHIEIDIHFVWDLVAAGQVRVLHVPSRYQFADIFTKGLPSNLFEEFRISLSIRYTSSVIDHYLGGMVLRKPFAKAYGLVYGKDEETATATVHHHSIRFKMNNKKRIVNLEYFREMLQIFPRIPNQRFDELPLEEEILAFLRELGQSGEIKMITNVNINKLYQPWRSFAAIINKCLSGKSIGYDSLYLSQAQILWGMYHKKNVDFSYLPWEDFVYQVEHKDAKKSNEMYYPRFTKFIVNFFMTKDQSILRRNKYGAILPVELMNEAIRNSESYKEYYVIASGAKPPKTKEKQPAKSSKAKGLTVLSEVALTEAEHIKLAIKRSLTQTHISHASGSGADEGTDDDDDDDDEKMSEHDDDQDNQDDDDDQDNQDDDNDEQTDSDNNDNDEDSHGMNIEGDEGVNEEDEANELYRDVNTNLEGQDDQMADVQTTQVIEDTHMTLTPVNPKGQQQSSSMSSHFISNMLNPSPNTCIDSIFESTPRLDVLVMTTAELPLLSVTTLPLPSIHIISHVQQTPAPSP